MDFAVDCRSLLLGDGLSEVSWFMVGVLRSRSVNFNSKEGWNSPCARPGHLKGDNLGAKYGPLGLPAEIGRPKSETLVPDRVRRFAVLIEWLVACKIKAGAI